MDDPPFRLSISALCALFPPYFASEMPGFFKIKLNKNNKLNRHHLAILKFLKVWRKAGLAIFEAGTQLQPFSQLCPGGNRYRKRRGRDQSAHPLINCLDWNRPASKI
jgi:hypothetical protein